MQEQDNYPDINAIQESVEYHFRRHAGSVAKLIVPVAETKWKENYPKRLATMIVYIRILSSYIVSENVREEFYKDAMDVLV